MINFKIDWDGKKGMMELLLLLQSVECDPCGIVGTSALFENQRGQRTNLLSLVVEINAIVSQR